MATKKNHEAPTEAQLEEKRIAIQVGEMLAMEDINEIASELELDYQSVLYRGNKSAARRVISGIADIQNSIDVVLRVANRTLATKKKKVSKQV